MYNANFIKISEIVPRILPACVTFCINKQIGLVASGEPTEHPKEEFQIRNIFQNLDLNVNEMIEPEEIDESLKGRTLFD